MTDNQSGKIQNKTDKKQPTNSGRIVLLGAGATALAIINMSAGTEAPSQGVLILEYAALAGGLIALAGGLIMMMTQK